MGTSAGAGATTATTAIAFAGATGTSVIGAGVGGCKGGKFLLKLGRAALRALGAFPIAGTHQDFAIFAAFFAMKLVDWHGMKITRQAKISRTKGHGPSETTRGSR